jgi:hypothetical protein
MHNPLYICKRAPEPLRIDGVMDETAWERTEVMNLRLTGTGAQPKLRTDVRALWDDDYLYIGYYAIDTDIWATMEVHDEPLWEEEVVEVFIDADSDGIGYVEFNINPLNTVFDVAVLNRTRVKEDCKIMKDWDCIGLKTAVTVDGDPRSRATIDRSWTTEVAIPFNQIYTAPNIPPENGDSWRINFYRIEQGRDGDEYTAWSPTGAINYHLPDSFGTIVFSTETV